MAEQASSPGHPAAAHRGGYRWLVLLLSWLAFTVTSTDRSAWGPSSLFIGKDLGVPLASLGVFATAYYVGYVASNAGSGLLIDRFGGRLLISLSLAGAGFSMLVFGSTTSAVAGIAIQAVVGMFAGVEYGAGVKLISSWFQPDELGKVMGVYTSATSLGVLIANLAVPWLIAHFDWTAAYRVFGAISLVSGLLCFLLVRPGPVVTTAIGDGDRTWSPLRALLGNRDLLLLALAGFGGFWGTYGFVIWSNTLMVRGRGFDPAVAGWIIAIFAAVGILGKPLVGAVSDRLGGARRVPAMVMLAMFAVMLVVFGLMTTTVGFVVAAPLLGLAGYCYLPMIVALVPRLVDTSVVGTAAGAVNAFWQLGSVLVPLAVGTVFVAAGNSFMAALLTLAVGPLLGVVAMFFVNERPAGVRVAAEQTPTA